MNQGTQGIVFKSATTLELNPMVQLLEMKSVTHFRINLWKGTGPEIFIHQNPFAIGDGYFQRVLIIWHSQAVQVSEGVFSVSKKVGLATKYYL